MTEKRLLAAVIATTLIVGISAGVYHDAGGNWIAVAAFWISMAILLGVVFALAWALDNWNAR